MSKIVECVPNISEGRDKIVIENIVDAVRNTPGCILMDYSSDDEHNRSVISFMGEPDSVLAAAVALAKKSASLIDLTKHRGEHPRMGAVDVIPFIPIRDMSMQECIVISKDAGKMIAEQAGIPVFLYEQSASSPHRENLADIRRGQFENMGQKVKDERWRPDFGGERIHPTAGVVAVGARRPLIAFNINLNTSDLNIAKEISRTVRYSGGGLSDVKAIGIMLEKRNVAQVSINMTDYTKTPLYRVLELVKIEAKRWGVGVLSTQIIGLSPMDALVDCAQYYLGIEDFDKKNQVIESHLLKER